MTKDAKKRKITVIVLSVCAAVILSAAAVWVNGALRNRFSENADTIPSVTEDKYAGETDAETIVKLFFAAFENGDFETMKQYCTANCIETYFGKGYVFGMEKAKLKTLIVLTGLRPEEIYDENTAVFEIHAAIKASPKAVFGDITKHSFFMVCKKQENGRYLIDSFATGL